MNAGRNNGPKRYTLPRNYILRGEKNFERLFSDGKRISARHVDLRYLLFEDAALGFKVAFVAGKKIGNAVTRNRCKRLLREAFRLHQHLISGHFEGVSHGFHGIFIAKSAAADFPVIQADCISLLTGLSARFEKKR